MLLTCGVSLLCHILPARIQALLCKTENGKVKTENRRNRSLYSKNIFIDFQKEMVLQRISADFLRMSENVFAESPWEKCTWSQLVDYQFCTDQISILDFLDFLEFLVFVRLLNFLSFLKILTDYL